MHPYSVVKSQKLGRGYNERPDIRSAQIHWGRSQVSVHRNRLGNCPKTVFALAWGTKSLFARTLAIKSLNLGLCADFCAKVMILMDRWGRGRGGYPEPTVVFHRHSSAFIGIPTGFALQRRKTTRMRKGFTREPKRDEPGTPVKNYITPSGLQRLKDEHRFLLMRERPAVVEVVAWAASNGDRSENADYQYGKRRLRQIDGRIRFLSKRIEAAEVVDPEAPRAGQAATKAFFGATVRYANAAGVSRVVSIVGTDEIDLNRNHISWVSPLGRALMKSAAGDSVVLQLPGGTENLTVLEVRYERISVEPFREPPGSESSAKELTRRS